MKKPKKKTGFDFSKIGIRIANEQKDDVERTTDPDLIAMQDESYKMKEEGLLEPKHEKEERFNSPDEKIEEFLDKNDIEKEVGYFINRKVISEILKIHPFITSARQLSVKANFPDKRYGQLNLKTKKWYRVDKQLIKNLASVLEIEDWRILIDHKMAKEYERNQEKAQKYLSDIKELEKKIKEENSEEYDEPKYSITNIVGK
tara:strand:- start:1022 stop:1627 length:606 start_codon:yes stop_codon:yes gene_type:complete